MKAGLTISAELTAEERMADRPRSSELRSSRAEAANVFDLEVLISRMEEGETRARAANLTLPASRAATVREALQMVIEQARGIITQSLANATTIPWVDPPALPDDDESRFIVPLVME